MPYQDPSRFIDFLNDLTRRVYDLERMPQLGRSSITEGRLRVDDEGHVQIGESDFQPKAPESPGNLDVVTGITTLGVFIHSSWSFVGSQDIREYRVIIKDFSGLEVYSANTTKNMYRAIGGFDGNTTYIVVIEAIGHSGHRAASLEEEVTTPAAPSVGSDGSPPSSSPTPTVSGAIGMLYVQWQPVENADPVEYEVHVSTTNNFTPNPGTHIGDTASTFTFITKTAGGSALSYTTTYYVKLVAKDEDGAAPPGSQGSGTPIRIDTDDILDEAIKKAKIAGGEVYVEHLGAVQVAAELGLFRNLVVNGLVTHKVTGTDAIFANAAIKSAAIESLVANKISSGSLESALITLTAGGEFRAGTTTNGVRIRGSGITQYLNGEVKMDLPINGPPYFSGEIFAATLTGCTINASSIRTTDFEVGTATNYLRINETDGFRMVSSGTTRIHFPVGGTAFFSGTIEASDIRATTFRTSTSTSSRRIIISPLGADNLPDIAYYGSDGFLDGRVYTQTNRRLDVLGAQQLRLRASSFGPVILLDSNANVITFSGSPVQFTTDVLGPLTITGTAYNHLRLVLGSITAQIRPNTAGGGGFNFAVGTGTSPSQIGRMRADAWYMEPGQVFHIATSSDVRAVTFGAENSGGTGFRVCRVPN